jgi:cation:H+ antiporter
VTSALIFVSGAALLIFSAEKLVGYLVGVASHLKVSVFLLAIIFTGIEFDDVVLGVALNLEDLDGVAMGVVFGTALSLPGIVLALAAIVAPCRVTVPRSYILLFALAPLVMVAFALMAPLTIVHGLALVGLFVLFVAYIAVQESRNSTPVFRDAELYEMYAAARRPGNAAALDGPGGSADDTGSTGGREDSGRGAEHYFADHMPFAGGRRYPGWIGVGLAIAALVGLIVGAATMSFGIEGLLEEYGLEATIFGATIATLVLTIEDIFLTVQPARKGAPEIGIGNVIGSVVFSLTGKLGIILLAGGIVIGPDVFVWHLPVLVGLTWVAAYFLSTGRLRPWHGYTLLVLYTAYWVVSFGVFGMVPIEMD